MSNNHQHLHGVSLSVHHTLTAVITQHVVLLTGVEGKTEAAFNNLHNEQTF